MRRWLPIVLLIALAGLLGLFLSRASHAPQPISAAPTEARAESLAAEPALQAESKDPRTELAPAALAPSVEPAAAPKPDPSAAHLTVHFVGKTTHGPVATVRVMLSPTANEDVRRETKHVESSSGDLHDQPITGADGVVNFDLPSGRDFRLWARGENERSGDAEADIPRMRASEQRDLVLEIADGIDGHVFGKVVCGETGEPVAGAHVNLENTGAGFRITIGGKPIRNRGKPASGGLTTGNDGMFELSCSLWQNPRVRVEAEGYGMRYANLEGLHEDIEHALIVRVSRAATLIARVLDASGAPIPEARIELSTKGFMLSYSEADEQGFFPSGLVSSPPDESWDAATGADGRAQIEGLPPRVELGIRVEANGRTLQHDPVGLRLQPGEVKELEWRIGSGTIVKGLVLDQDGKPVSGIEIWAAKAISADRRFFLRHERDRVASRATTSLEGGFTLMDLLPGRWSIGPGGGPDSQVVALAEIVELAGEPMRELNLHVFRGLSIRGRVLTPTGEPASGSWVSGLGQTGEYYEGINARPDGTFAFGPVTLGTVTLTASAMDKFASSDPVQASGGDTSIVLQLRLGGAIRGRVVDGVTGSAQTAQLLFAPEQHGSGIGMFSNGMETSTQSDGSFSSSGFEAGKWSVIATTADGRFAQQAHLDVSAGSDTGELVFTLSPGGKLKLGYKGADPRVFVTICCQGAPIQFQSSLESGKSFDHLAPAGSLVLEIRKRYDGPARTKAVELKAGETKEVLLTDDD